MTDQAPVGDEVEIPEEVLDLLIAAALQHQLAKVGFDMWLLGKGLAKGSGQIKVVRAVYAPKPAEAMAGAPGPA